MTLMHRLFGLNRELYSAHTGVGFGVIASSKQTVVPVGGWVELARDTLGSPANTLTVTGIADKRYLKFFWHATTKPSASETHMQLGNASFDTATNYASRRSVNGGSDSTEVTQNHMRLNNNALNAADWGYGYISNLAGKEKLCLSWMEENINGAANVPAREETVNKWTNTSNVIDRLKIFPKSGGNWGTGSEMVVLAWDPADIHTDNFWEELASVNASGSSTNLSSGTITAKKYLWVQAWVESISAHVTNMTFNNDTTTYAYRNSDDGGADATSASDSHIEIAQSSSTALFTNMFIINNSANEKLVIGHTINQGTAGAGTASNRREFVGKYDNTSAQITEIDLDSSSGNWASNSIIKVWGSN